MEEKANTLPASAPSELIDDPISSISRRSGAARGKGTAKSPF
jgi:hypothetical protein